MKYLIAIIALFLFAPSSAHALWLDSNWDYRVKVEIAPSKVGTTTAVTSFPVYLNLANMPASFFTNASSTGADIRVTESDEITETPFELVTFATTTQTGELHFLADSLSTTSSSTFYVYYGNPTASAYAVTDTYGRNAVWTGYRAVYHLESLTLDSTGNGYTLTNNNSVAASSTCKIAGCADFGSTNTNKSLSIASNLGIDGGNNSMTAWYAPHSSTATVGGVIETGSTGTDVYNSLWYHGGVPASYQSRNRSGISDAFSNVSGVIGSGVFTYAAYTYDSSNVLGYRDAVAATPAAHSGNGSFNITTQSTIGKTERFGVFFTGLVDEVRVSSNALSAAYILTEYNNQSAPSTFYALGAEENNTEEATTTPSTILQGGVWSGGTIIR